MSKKLGVEEVVELLNLETLPIEGGQWTQTVRDDSSSAIYYLITNNDFSAMHRLEVPEVYHYYCGASTQLLLLYPEGQVSEPVLGSDLTAGERPQIVVPAGVWQGSSTLGEWSLLGTTMSPPYTDEMFKIGSRSHLINGWPTVANRIIQLTHD